MTHDLTGFRVQAAPQYVNLGCDGCGSNSDSHQHVPCTAEVSIEGVESLGKVHCLQKLQAVLSPTSASQTSLWRFSYEQKHLAASSKFHIH